MGLFEGMKQHKGSRKMILYWDIETLTYNKVEGRKQPTNYKNVVYSVAVGWNNGGQIDVEVFPSFEAFFETFFEYAERKDTITKSRTSIEMIAHNNNKYDNHFLLHDLLLLYPFERLNTHLKQTDDNTNTIDLGSAKKESKILNMTLEKRVKSSINLDLDIFLNGWRFTTVDNVMKTSSSIDMLGKKLKDLGFLSDVHLKTDFNYEIFDVDHDMTEEQAHLYASWCFKQLDNAQMQYIYNDVIILGQSHIHYSDMFPNFDYSKPTFSVNILNSYLENELTRFQLLNQYEKEKISYTNYMFDGMNLYDYIKGFYRGGLNMYNSRFVNQIIDEPCFSIDLNSSYPYVMYHEKIPTFLSSYESFEFETEVPTNLDNDNYFTLFKMSKQAFNTLILPYIDSIVLKQMIVKYYNNDRTVNINTNTLRLLQTLTDMDLSEIRVESYITFECHYFGARNIIHENYKTKTQGKLKNKINMPTPYDYTITDEINEKPYSQEEVALSKVILNGLYGIPALRSHFNLFRLDDEGELFNIVNGYKNTERNILFSTFVTSQALYNLLEPLKYLTQQQIDTHFIYCDTDSLYLKKGVFHQLPESMFDPISLGAWDIEHETIEKMFVLNHKKYAYLTDGKINVASAGIPNDAFNYDQSFDDFIQNDFHHGAIVENLKSIYNKQGIISLYPSETYIEKGENYPTVFNQEDEERKEAMFEQIRQNYDFTQDEDFLYIESHLGSFSFSDVFQVVRSIESAHTIDILKDVHNDIKKTL